MQDMKTRLDHEKVLVVVVEFKYNVDWLAEDVAAEMVELVKACDGEVVDTVICRLDKPTAKTLIGEGKVREIAELVQHLHADSVVFSYDLKGSQQRNLEGILEAKTIDRTQLILDIFARRARSQEGKMQVELAQLDYLLPRLVGKGIALSRLGGGIGTLGPGETKLEVDRRRIGQRIAKLKRELKEMASNRAIKRKKRKDLGTPLISLVGYTNAGKSTLLNMLTEANTLTRDGLFTTLDPLSRKFTLPNHQKLVVSDTVGFMHALPHHLVEAFLATLEEAIDADVLLHVIDVSHPQSRKLAESVMQVLTDLDVVGKPMITVLNKIDKIPDRGGLGELEHFFQNGVSISAKTHENSEALLDKITEQLASLIVQVEIDLPLDRMDLVSQAHKEGQVFSIKYYNDRIYLRAALPAQLAGRLSKEALDADIDEEQF